MSKKKRKRRKHRSVLPYITTPLIYVLISLVFVVPICLGLLNYSMSLVHKAQPSFAYSISDIKLNDKAFKPSQKTSGTVARTVLYPGDKTAELTCSSCGLDCSVYYGENRISSRGGAGMKTEVLPGDTGICEIYGSRSGAFSCISSIKTGDKIKLVTNWGSYVYTVSTVKIGTEPPDSTMPQSLMLVTSAGDKTFSNFNDEKLYILADIESGPQLEEVRK